MHVLYTENKHGKVPNLSTIAIIIDDVLLEHVGLTHVLPIVVQLQFLILDGLRGSS